VKSVTESHNPLSLPLSSVGSRVSVSRAAATLESPVAAAEQKRLITHLSSPFIRQDIFYAGSITSLREYKTSQDMVAYVQVSIFYKFLFTHKNTELRLECKTQKTQKTKGALQMYCLPVAISDSVRLCHCTLMLSLVTSLILTAFS